MMEWRCNVYNCGGGECVHELTDEKCPLCGRKMVRVKPTGFMFCSNPDQIYGCDYEKNFPGKTEEVDKMDNERHAIDNIPPEEFPPLITGENRPVTWHYQLDGVEGREEEINSVTIFSRPVLKIDESGEHDLEEFAVVTLTRDEIAEILRILDDDMAAFLRAVNKETP